MQLDPVCMSNIQSKMAFSKIIDSDAVEKILHVYVGFYVMGRVSMMRKNFSTGCMKYETF